MFLNNRFSALYGSVSKINIDDLFLRISPFSYVSFDLFDTLVKRNVENPKDIFKIMELSIGDHFAEKRIEAEKKARSESCFEEITLEEIYNAFPQNHKNRLKSIELQTEFDAIVPNLPIIELYQKCIACGKKVFITTDMYWSLKDIKKLLHHVGVDIYDEIYLSSDFRKTKRTGSLFKIILEQQNISPNNLIHIGDHPNSDSKIPRGLGISAILIPKRIEKIKFNKKKDKQLKNIYLNNFINNTYCGDYDPYSQFGYSQFGKLLWGYSKWIYRNALENEINKLFFFSRDGWIMKQAFDLCINDPKIKTYYLEVSRRSLRVPTLWIDFNYKNILNMVVNAKLITIISIFDNLGLDINDYTDQLTKFGFTKDTIFDRNTIHNNKDLKTLIFSLKNDIISNSKKEFEALSIYLKSQGVCGKFGVVDIGYGGSMQRYLQQVLKKLCIPNEITGFYLAVADNYKKNDYPDNSLKLKGYLFDFKQNPNSSDTRSSYVGLFESLFLEQGGSVKRYIESGGGVIVDRYQYEYFHNGKYSDTYNNIKSLQRGALDFVIAANKDRLLNFFNYNVDDLFYGIFETGTNPGKYELDLFSDIEFYDEGITTKLAAPKGLLYYCFNLNSLKKDFLFSRWKIGFMKKLFKMKIPYQKIYLKMKKVEKK